jgi:hypothetical protein
LAALFATAVAGVLGPAGVAGALAALFAAALAALFAGALAALFAGALAALFAGALAAAGFAVVRLADAAATFDVATPVAPVAAFDADRSVDATGAAAAFEPARVTAVGAAAERRGVAERVVAVGRVVTVLVALFFVVGLVAGDAGSSGAAAAVLVRPVRAATGLAEAVVDFRDGGTWPSSAPPYGGYNDRRPGPVPPTRG